MAEAQPVILLRHPSLGLGKGFKLGIRRELRASLKEYRRRVAGARLHTAVRHRKPVVTTHASAAQAVTELAT